MNHPKLQLVSGAALLCCLLLSQATVLAAPQDATPGAAAPEAATAPAPAKFAGFKAGDELPVGPQVKVGKLANGLTYYIQKNNKPEKKLELRLVVKAGSILEDEDQQGLAHFTEHMAFNGSTHFKKSALISYLQSIGVKFGADLNAYTSFDETVYVLPIPTDKRENVDKGFLVLEDWAHGLAMNARDIDSERAIVLEEARLGKGADDRMRKVLMPKLLNGSRYAQRLPIGKEQVLKTFKYDAIRRFYRDWYRPNLMAVVVVGDIEPAEAEALITRHFAHLKNPLHERPREYAKIPTRAATEGVVITDKEASSNVLFIRYPIEPLGNSNTYGYYRQNLIESLYGEMLSARMQELTQQATPPFIQGGSNMAKVVRGYKSYNAYALIGKAGVQPAIDALVQEDERARQFGFSAAELERSKKNMLRNFERVYKERDKSDSAGYVAEYLRHFLEQESIPGIANEYDYVRQMLPLISLEEVNAEVARAIPGNVKKLVVYMGSDESGAQHGDNALPTAPQLLAAVAAAEKSVVTPAQEKVYASRLMEAAPAAGSIVAESQNQALGLTELTLSNGVKVVLKPTDFKNDQVLMGSTRFGGQSRFGDADIYNARYASAIIGQMGVKDFAPTDLQKILAGKTVSAGSYLSTLSEGMGGSAGSADVETLLQLVYLTYTAPRTDVALYQSFIGKQRELARNAMSQPESVFRDTVQATLYNNNPRVARVARPEDFDKVSLERVMEIQQARFASARGTTFFFVGSFDVAAIKPLIATYLASLPAAPIEAAYVDLGVRPVTGVVKKAVYEGAEPKSVISLTFTGTADYSEVAQLSMQALVEVLNIKLIEVVREKLGLIYGGGMSGSLSKLPYGSYAIGANFPTGPESVDKVIAATFAEIQKIKDNGPAAGDLAKVKRNWLENHQKALRENSYWMGRLQGALTQGEDPAAILQYEAEVQAITAQDVQRAAQRYFDLKNYVQVVLYPAKK